MVHKFINNNTRIAYDVESGSVFELDEISYDLLGENGLVSVENLTGKYPLEELVEARGELEELITEGLLYSEPLQESLVMKNTGVKALCLHVAHDCNLRCRYCFASQGDFKGERSLMSLETAKQAIDFVVESSGKRKNIEIDFFGGEPLLNYEVVRETVSYARSLEEKFDKHFRFTITTNGVLLSENNKAWLNENMDNIVLSHDGRKEVNDRMRPTPGGSGSYEIITPKIIEMAKLRQGKKDYYIRGTYTDNNTDFSQDVMHFVDLGLNSISIEPVVAGEDEDYRLREENIEELKKEYEKLAKLALLHDFNFFHFNIDFSGGPCLYKRLSGCGAGTDYLAVTPTGDIYPCHQFVSDPDFKIGSLSEGITNPEIREKFAHAGLAEKEACKNCWVRYICGGGCHANSYAFNHTLNEPYRPACELEKARVESAMMIYVKKTG